VGFARTVLGDIDAAELGVTHAHEHLVIAGGRPVEFCPDIRLDSDRVYHLHAKDISMEHSSAERGKVTGTPVGCGCGDGVVDFRRVMGILADQDRELFLSVECGTVDQAARSIEYLTPLIEAANA
jgi:sugar phosphate isomerase/epimerase